MHIRPLTEQDFTQCVAIMNQAIQNGKNAFDAPLDGADAQTWFNDLYTKSHAALALIAPDGVLAGWGNLSAYRSKRGGLKHVAEVSFYLDESFTGKGWGHLVLGALEAKAQSIGLTVLVAILRSDNTHSRSFLSKKGYTFWACFEGLIQLEQESIGHLYMGKHLKQ